MSAVAASMLKKKKKAAYFMLRDGNPIVSSGNELGPNVTVTTTPPAHPKHRGNGLHVESSPRRMQLRINGDLLW